MRGDEYERLTLSKAGSHHPKANGVHPAFPDRSRSRTPSDNADGDGAAVAADAAASCSSTPLSSALLRSPPAFPPQLPSLEIGANDCGGGGGGGHGGEDDGESEVLSIFAASVEEAAGAATAAPASAFEVRKAAPMRNRNATTRQRLHNAALSVGRGFVAGGGHGRADRAAARPGGPPGVDTKCHTCRDIIPVLS